MQVYGHRGINNNNSNYLENTKPAFDRALADGAHGVELDVWETKDGKLVVFHDDTPERLMQVKNEQDIALLKKTISDLTYEELAEKLEFKHDTALTLPLLEEVIMQLKNSAKLDNQDKTLNIELKGKGAAKSVWSMIWNHIPKEWADKVTKEAGVRFLVSSFDFKELRVFHQQLTTKSPWVKVGVLIDPDKAKIDNITTLIHKVGFKPDVAVIVSPDLTQELVAHMKNEGIEIITWGVEKTPELLGYYPHYESIVFPSLEKLQRWGVKAIITDDPAERIKEIGQIKINIPPILLQDRATLFAR